MIQIMGLRPYVDRKTGEIKRKHAFFTEGWRAESHSDLFKNLDFYLDQIPEQERFNIFYTTAICTEERRVFQSQNIIPIDIDGIAPGKTDKYIKTTLEALNLWEHAGKVGQVHSGNGIHLLVQSHDMIDDKTTFNNLKPAYKIMCGIINEALFNAGLPGQADPVMWDSRRLLRLPNTINRKDNRPDKPSTLIQANIEPIVKSLADLVGFDEVSSSDTMDAATYNTYISKTVDQDAVLNDCLFLQHCKENQATLSEPEWYAMLGLVGRLPDGDKLIHEYSKDHPGYHRDTTDSKKEYAISSSGPRKCESIQRDFFPKCSECKHHGKLTCPLQAQSEDFEPFKMHGYYQTKVVNGIEVKDKKNPSYQCLVKAFNKKHKAMYDTQSFGIITYDGKRWEDRHPKYVLQFAYKKLDPPPSSTMCKEFKDILEIHKVNYDGLNPHQDKLNFNNGVFDVEKRELLTHSPKFRFSYVLPYDYDPYAQDTTKFDTFLHQIFSGDEQLIQLVTEYLGFILSGVHPKYVQKCMILHGDGSNGKSRIIELLNYILGEENISGLNMSALNSVTSRSRMVNKILNCSDETPKSSLLESEAFKQIVSGDSVPVRRYYQDEEDWTCNVKLLFCCNSLPASADHSLGLNRRLIIVPLRAKFLPGAEGTNPKIIEEMLDERSAIINKCLKAFERVKENNYKFTQAKACKEQLEAFKQNSDPVMSFAVDMVGVKPEDKDGLSSEKLYAEFALWADMNGERRLTKRQFDRRIQPILVNKYENMKTTRPRINGRRITHYVGFEILGE